MKNKPSLKRERSKETCRIRWRIQTAWNQTKWEKIPRAN